MMHLMTITITSTFKLTTCNNKWMISKRRLMIIRLIKFIKLLKRSWMPKTTLHELVFILRMLMTCSTRAWLKQGSHPQLMFAIRLRNWTISLSKWKRQRSSLGTIKLGHLCLTCDQFTPRQHMMVCQLVWRNQPTRRLLLRRLIKLTLIAWGWSYKR